MRLFLNNVILSIERYPGIYSYIEVHSVSRRHVSCVCQYVNWFHVIERTDFIGRPKNNINRTTKTVSADLPQCACSVKSDCTGVNLHTF